MGYHTPNYQKHDIQGKCFRLEALWNITVKPDYYSVKKMDASAIVISIVYPPNDDMVREQLLHLRRLLPPGVLLLAGGNAASSYADTLQKIDAKFVDDMTQLREQLLLMRSSIKHE